MRKKDRACALSFENITKRLDLLFNRDDGFTVPTNPLIAELCDFRISLDRKLSNFLLKFHAGISVYNHQTNQLLKCTNSVHNIVPFHKGACKFCVTSRFACFVNIYIPSEGLRPYTLKHTYRDTIRSLLAKERTLRDARTRICFASYNQ